MVTSGAEQPELQCAHPRMQGPGAHRTHAGDDHVLSSFAGAMGAAKIKH